MHTGFEPKAGNSTTAIKFCKMNVEMRVVDMEVGNEKKLTHILGDRRTDHHGL